MVINAWTVFLGERLAHHLSLTAAHDPKNENENENIALAGALVRAHIGIISPEFHADYNTCTYVPPKDTDEGVGFLRDGPVTPGTGNGTRGRVLDFHRRPRRSRFLRPPSPLPRWIELP